MSQKFKKEKSFRFKNKSKAYFYGNGNSNTDGIQTVINIFNVGIIKNKEEEATSDVGNNLGRLIGVSYYKDTLSGNYRHLEKSEIVFWSEEEIKQNLGAEFKKDKVDENEKYKNDGLPILNWQ